MDSNSFGIPGEVANLRLRFPVEVLLEWNPQGSAAGSGIRYDIIGGRLSLLRTTATFQDASCLRDQNTSPAWIDFRSQPPVNDGYYYLIRAQNPCGTATYGSSSVLPDPRDYLDALLTSACP